VPNASYCQDSFAGGEKSQLAQGRITDREYRTWLNVCVNSHPTEAGGLVRRSGTMFAGATRSGAKGRVIRFDFAQATPYTIEFTDGFMRFRSGTQWAITNDTVGVASISAANPAVLQTQFAVTWVTGNTVIFSTLGPTAPLLQNRQFLITRIDSTHFSLQDAIGGANIDGSTLGPVGVGTKVSRIHEITSPYIGGIWSTVRIIQAETTGVVLQGTLPPQLLQVTTPPSSGVSAQFNLSNLTFLDGPYLDPFVNGVQANPSGVSGNIALTLSFPTWSATQAYKVGDFVTSTGNNYTSLIDNNVNLTPAGNPSAWVVTSASAAINSGKGFTGADIGRLVRLFSEPIPWTATQTFGAGVLASYAGTYWNSLVGANTGNVPGNDTTHWALATNAAIWSWGKITSLSTLINSHMAGSALFTDDFNHDGNGLNPTTAAFDGVNAKPSASCANFFGPLLGTSSFWSLSLGVNFTGATPQKISTATVFPSTDQGFVGINVTNGLFSNMVTMFTINLRAKQTAPVNSADGTLLATTGGIANTTTAVTLQSSDTTTAWNYIWFEISLNVVDNASVFYLPSFFISQILLFGLTGTGTGSGVNIEVLGPPLLYTNPVNTWRLGAYSNATGWPTCGTYHEGRLWLAGAIGNRFDASVSNGLSGTTLNMAPTDQNGVVGAANGITGVVNSDGVNPIFWLSPDLQGILAGTLAGEWLIFAPAVTSGLSPTNIAARRVTRIGCANVEPRRTDHTLAFVQRYAKKVMEYFADVYSGKFAAPNLAKDTLHITKPLVVELAYGNANIPILWGRNTDGSWWGTTYKRDSLTVATGPNINGWHRHQLGSGRSVQSMAIGPSVGGNLDALTLVTLDPATGVYHVEVLTDVVDEGNTLLQATYLDDAVSPTSTTTSNITPPPYGGLTLNGLWHLNGKTVTAWLGGLDCGDYAVASGSITVPYGDGVSAGTAQGLFTAAFAAGLTLSQMLVGFTFTSQGQLVRPALPTESGARSGPAVGKVRRGHKFAAQLEGTGVGLQFGTRFTKLFPALFRQPNDTAYLVNQQFTGVFKTTLQDDYGFDGMLCWQQTRPLPVNIANLSGMLETQDE
jgi:chitodextrinase